MAINKVELSDGTVLMDTSGVSVTAETLGKGETALDASGALITGLLEASSGGDTHVVTTDCTNASTVVDYFRKLRPEGCSDMIIALKPPEGMTAFSKMENGQMLALVLNGTKAGYARWYSNAVNVQTTFTTSYTCKCWVGDEYYLMPLV